MADNMLKLVSQDLHEKIDQLRKLGVGADINLPQLVVVGDQSSGKSSLLEALTNLPFPVASDVCTRFATCVVFHRRPQPENTYKVSIIPKSLVTSGHKEHLDRFSKDFEGFTLTRESFANVIKKAPEYMGLEKPLFSTTVTDVKKRFFEDILNVEVSGPDQPQLSIIDLPGLFHSDTPLQSIEDRGLVRSLVEHFVKDSRTIILAVFNAAVNLALQEVFTIAKQFDPDGQRTIGVMTHCDRVQDGAETQPINTALNQVQKLHHGWYCVRNRTPDEVLSDTSIDLRNENERKFFETSAKWSVISESRRGVAALMKALYHLLSDHISREFPKIQAEITGRLEDAQVELIGLGPSRKNDQERTRYLITLSAAYERLVAASLSGQYSIHADNLSKLRTLVQNANDEFNNLMHKSGFFIPFQNPGAGTSKPHFNDSFGKPFHNEIPRSVSSTSSIFGNAYPANPPRGTPEDKFGPEEARLSAEERKFAEEYGYVPQGPEAAFGTPIRPGEIGNSTTETKSNQRFGGTAFGQITKGKGFNQPFNRFRGDATNFFGDGANELVSKSDISHSVEEVKKSFDSPKSKIPETLAQNDIYTYIRKEYKESRGTELPGHVHPSLLERLFYDQSRKWEAISMDHIAKTWKSVSDCHQLLLSQICKADLTTCSHLRQFFDAEWVNSKREAEQMLRSLLSDERTGPLLTRNDEFAQNLSTARTDRIFSRLNALGLKDGASFINFQQLASLVHLSNEDFTLYDVHDTLKAYYDVALKRFIDNVVTQVVERTLLGENGPLQLFNTEWVTGLSTSQLAAITAEDYATKTRREELNAKIQRLEQAKIICSSKEG